MFTLLTLANSGGPAASNGRGYTGAPSAGGGTEGNCGQCHRGGDLGSPLPSVRFDGDTLSAYEPGRTYAITVAVTGAPAAPAYGFQAQVLDTTDNTAGSLSDPGDGVRITDLSNGRVYAEHSTPNEDTTFAFQWTAPEAGTGPVSVYAIANAVNLAAGTGGDNGGNEPVIVALAEATTTATYYLETIDYRLFPNPAHEFTILSLEIVRAGRYDLRLRSLTGAIVHQRTLDLGRGGQQIDVPVADLAGGVYLLELSGAGYGMAERVIVR